MMVLRGGLRVQMRLSPRPVTITVTASHVDPGTIRLRPVHEPVNPLI
jgi:hypothetical protein